MDSDSKTAWIILMLVFLAGGFGGGIVNGYIAKHWYTTPEQAPRTVMPSVSFAIAPDGKPIAVNTNWTMFAADYDGDGIPDLWIIKHNNTGTHSTEVHILKGPQFQVWLQHCGTPLEETPGYITVAPPVQAEKQ
jgi:hypothetical protein